MIKAVCYATLAVWLYLIIRHRWRVAGLVVDARRANKNPYINRNDP